MWWLLPWPFLYFWIKEVDIRRNVVYNTLMTFIEFLARMAPFTIMTLLAIMEWADRPSKKKGY